MGKKSKDRRDIYYRVAKENEYRARSAYKLIQIHEEFNILSKVTKAVDLCAAPGGWSQVLYREMTKECKHTDDIRIIAVDLAPIQSMDGVMILQGDITKTSTALEIVNLLNGERADIVTCDGAPDVIGMMDIDEYVQNCLVLSALNMCHKILADNGTYVTKVFRGKNIHILMKQLQKYFKDVRLVKPKACRNSSVEAFILCRGYILSNETIDISKPLLLDMNIDISENSMFDYDFKICGSSKLDADRSYKLETTHNDELSEYQYRETLAKPIAPPYEEYLSKK